MTQLVHILNIILGFAVDILYLPLSALGPFWSLTVISLVVGVMMLWIFGKVSDQDKIKRSKDIIQANLIAIRLFQNDMGVFFRIFGRVLLDTLIYMKYQLKPMLVMIVPVILILIQLNWRYGARSFEPGETLLVKVKVTDASKLNDISLEPCEGIVVETPGVRIAPEKEISWRIRVEKEGVHTLKVKNGGAEVTKRLIAGPTVQILSPLRTGKGMLDLLLYPGESPIDTTTGIESIETDYPYTDVPIWGWKINWLIQFFVLSIAFGYMLKGFFGVHI